MNHGSEINQIESEVEAGGSDLWDALNSADGGQVCAIFAPDFLSLN